MSIPSLFADIERCLDLAEPVAKCSATARLHARVTDGAADWGCPGPVAPIGSPGRPAAPRLVAPAEVPRRRLGSREGRAALVHAIAHIEFNAINLALDAAWRFRGMPDDYYGDWLSVAADEARHFLMLEGRLRALGHRYGDFPAHNGLWEMAIKTAGSCLERMALVPRVLEARGLDVTPGMIERLEQAGDRETVDVLRVILEEEVRHVEIGSFWYRWCCRVEGIDPERTFLALLERHFHAGLRGPFNLAARARAGFSERELQALMSSVQ